MEEKGTAQRALFIIDPKGIVRAITINDADVGRSVDETLRILDALAFKDEFGEGCPVDWKKEDKGIEIAAMNRINGRVDLKKSWPGWAAQAAKPISRPGLLRAFSSASQRDGRFGSSLTTAGYNRRFVESSDNLTAPRGNTSTSPSTVSSSQHSPLLSPTSGDMNAGGSMQVQMGRMMAQQGMDNLQAALQNRDENQGIG